MQYIADSTFNINPQALAILAVLSKAEPTFAKWNAETKRYDIDILTRPWYNGRERGIALVVSRVAVGQALVITFGEQRNSDAIFVDHWTMNHNPAFHNGPSVIDFPEEAYMRRTYFKCFDIGGAMKYIYRTMKDYYEQA